jgi:hypothetical protein
MEIQAELEKLTKFLPIETLNQKVAYAVKFMPEPITHLLPSIGFGSDGLTLTGLLLVSANCICDIRIAGTGSNSAFDFIAKKSVANYRFNFWKQEIKQGESASVTYDVLAVSMVHHTPTGFRTELSYAGMDKDAWLAQLFEAIPLEAILT